MKKPKAPCPGRSLRPFVSACTQSRGRCLLLRLLLFLTHLLIAACGSPPMRPYVPTARSISQDPDRVYAAAVRVFLNRGYGFQDRDPNARAIETDWLTHRQTSSYETFLSYRVLVDRGTLTIATSCKVHDLFWGGEKPCPSGARPPDTPDLENEVVQEILAELKRSEPSESDNPATTSSAAPSATSVPRGGAECVSVCGKDRQSCLVACGKNGKCAENCHGGYKDCLKACSGQR
jgi:hypothetical protein